MIVLCAVALCIFLFEKSEDVRWPVPGCGSVSWDVQYMAGNRFFYGTEL